MFRFKPQNIFIEYQVDYSQLDRVTKELREQEKIAGLSEDAVKKLNEQLRGTESTSKGIKSVTSQFSGLTNTILGKAGLAFGISEVTSLLIDFTKEAVSAANRIQKQFRISQAEADKLAKSILALSKVSGTSIDTLIDSVSALRKEFSLTSTEITEGLENDLINLRERGEPFLQLLREYSPALVRAGFSFDQARAAAIRFLESGEQSADRSLDAINNFTIEAERASTQVREAFSTLGLTEALEQAQGGQITFLNLLQQTATALDEQNLDISTYSNIITTLFTSVGEESSKATLEIIRNLDDQSKAFQELETDADKAAKKLIEAQKEANAVAIQIGRGAQQFFNEFLVGTADAIEQTQTFSEKAVRIYENTLANISDIGNRFVNGIRGLFGAELLTLNRDILEQGRLEEAALEKRKRLYKEFTGFLAESTNQSEQLLQSSLRLLNSNVDEAGQAIQRNLQSQVQRQQELLRELKEARKAIFQANDNLSAQAAAEAQFRTAKTELEQLEQQINTNISSLNALALASEQEAEAEAQSAKLRREAYEATLQTIEAQETRRFIELERLRIDDQANEAFYQNELRRITLDGINARLQVIESGSQQELRLLREKQRVEKELSQNSGLTANRISVPIVVPSLFDTVDIDARVDEVKTFLEQVEDATKESTERQVSEYEKLNGVIGLTGNIVGGLANAFGDNAQEAIKNSTALQGLVKVTQALAVANNVAAAASALQGVAEQAKKPFPLNIVALSSTVAAIITAFNSVKTFFQEDNFSIPGFADGVVVLDGPGIKGGQKDDKNLAYLSRGESVIISEAGRNRANREVMEMFNQGRNLQEFTISGGQKAFTFDGIKPNPLFMTPMPEPMTLNPIPSYDESRAKLQANSLDYKRLAREIADILPDALQKSNWGRNSTTKLHLRNDQQGNKLLEDILKELKRK